MFQLSALISIIISVIFVLVAVLVKNHVVGCAQGWKHIGRFAAEAA